MGRLKKVDRTVHKKIGIPESVVTKVDLELFSELQGRVPISAYADLVTELLKKWLREERGVKV
jgi:hypothetical protein